MFSSQKQSKTVIRISDEELSFLSLSKNKNGFFVENYDAIILPPGIIERGEILKADIFSTMLKKIRKQIQNNNIDILLPHESFLFHDGELEPETKKQPIKKRIKNYFSKRMESDPWQKTHVCESQLHYSENKDLISFNCLPKEVQNSYIHICKKSGLNVVSIHSDVLSFGHIIETGSLLYIDHFASRIIEFKNGMYISHKTFELSYKKIAEDIMKNISLSKEKALELISKYGLLRTHSDEKVYKRIIRTTNPLLDFFKKSKSKSTSNVFIAYGDIAIPGLADSISQVVKKNVTDVNIFKQPQYMFQDFLSLHKKDSYKYQPHIAQALLMWKK